MHVQGERGGEGGGGGRSCTDTTASIWARLLCAHHLIGRQAGVVEAEHLPLAQPILGSSQSAAEQVSAVALRGAQQQPGTRLRLQQLHIPDKLSWSSSCSTRSGWSMFL